MGVVTRGLMSGENTAGCDYRTFVAARLAQLADKANVRLPAAIEVAAAPPLPAFVAQGRWVVDCPDCGSNRSMVWLSEPLYMCPVCWNASAGGDWRRVEVRADWREVEAALLERSLPDSRNCLPTETVAALVAENAAMFGGQG